MKEQAAPIIGQSPDTNNPLPVLHLAATGQLLASNLDDFKTKALNALVQINTDLATEQDFADAEQSAKWCKQVESALTKAKETLCAQAGIALTLNELSAIESRFKSTRLTLDKTIKAKKKNLKQRYIEVNKTRVREYIQTLNEGLPDEYHVSIPAGLTVDLTAAIKGLKTLSSMQNALDSVVLKYQSEANQEFQHKQQRAQIDALEAEAPPISPARRN